jgi:hypothetical protein
MGRRVRDRSVRKKRINVKLYKGGAPLQGKSKGKSKGKGKSKSKGKGKSKGKSKSKSKGKGKSMSETNPFPWTWGEQDAQGSPVFDLSWPPSADPMPTKNKYELPQEDWLPEQPLQTMLPWDEVDRHIQEVLNKIASFEEAYIEELGNQEVSSRQKHDSKAKLVHMYTSAEQILKETLSLTELPEEYRNKFSEERVSLKSRHRHLFPPALRRAPMGRRAPQPDRRPSRAHHATHLWDKPGFHGDDFADIITMKEDGNIKFQSRDCRDNQDCQVSKLGTHCSPTGECIGKLVGADGVSHLALSKAAVPGNDLYHQPRSHPRLDKRGNVTGFVLEAGKPPSQWTPPKPS